MFDGKNCTARGGGGGGEGGLLEKRVRMLFLLRWSLMSSGVGLMYLLGTNCKGSDYKWLTYQGQTVNGQTANG